ncbi:hypothetical protein TraAM80_04728 [Trypanosoma rangeli]|uniref:Uncharacterized protein n=1 Tax=Trypanosoma rangeli TaxID=5698 RepID=A0A3R7MMA8_TRYRA|nr:uncharacterized protein TraAM80_04728 [Trypanosoma rangeli]RNF05082.1 hypothetical protein TraAM80_04728 [Trypanosoma rangeli]|eukprot:RNF05082.1 hypothetical protein TraAM80_04728 [Trypanosoma rangeli]
MRVATERVCLPSGERLSSFPEPVVQKMRRIAFAVLRRLFSPVLRRHVATLHRRKALTLWRRLKDLEAELTLVLERLSAPVQCAQKLGADEALTGASGANKAYRCVSGLPCVYSRGDGAVRGGTGQCRGRVTRWKRKEENEDGKRKEEILAGEAKLSSFHRTHCCDTIR